MQNGGPIISRWCFVPLAPCVEISTWLTAAVRGSEWHAGSPIPFSGLAFASAALRGEACRVPQGPRAGCPLQD